MWYWLRAKRFKNLKFRRQHRIGPYIVDYYCRELGLVLEIDGDVHAVEKQLEKDRIRTQFLRERGLTVVRYSNNDVRLNLGSVLHDLFEITEAMRGHPLPTLSLKRERGILKSPLF